MDGSDSGEYNNPPAADPKEDHATPGGQPGDNTPSQDVETTVTTPGGTEVTESPAESGSGDE